MYRALPHEDSGFTVVNKRGAEVQIPGIIYDKKSQSIISFNQNGQPIFPPFKKVKLDRNNDPRTTFLYEYIGINEDDAPVYRLINKKGMSYRGNILIENGRNRSVLKYNNVVPNGYEIMPEEPITWVTDLTPVKASLQAKAFNQAGEFNTDMLANIQQTVKTQQATEPLSYQEWVKDYQTQKGEADAEAAYQQYLDNFEYSKSQGTHTVPTTKIISGGQTGIDRLGLEVGKELGLETGGTTTPGYYTENGRDESLKDFGVTEISPELQAGRKGREFYLPRTEQNVLNSDGTVYFSTDEDSAGRIATQRFAKQHNKPFLLNPTSQELAQWLVDNNIGTLNVAGNRGSKVSPEFDSQVRDTIRNAFSSPIQQDLFASQQPSKQSSIPANLAETWSQKEGWSTEYFNSKVLPKINEAWQIEYELAPDQSVPAKFKGNMTFDYGEHGRPGLKSKSTIEAVRNGERTATTRYESQEHLDYWKQAQVGDVIEWKRGDESVKVLVTKPLTKLRTSDATQQDLFASEQSSETINIYAGTGENADLSNFAVRPFTISGDKSESSIRIGGNFQTVEGAFQAQKLVFSSMSDDEKEAIRKQLETASGSQARSIGRKIKDLNTVSWDKASSDVMRDLLLESFSQNPEALNRLLSTGDATLTHTQDKGKWGTEFPKILMEVRELLRNRSNIKQPAITDTTKEFLDYANQFGFTDEAALLAKDLPKASKEAKKVEEEYVFTFNDGFKINLPFSLNDQQKSALYELEKFIEDYGTEITLSGYAGTGKSTIIGIFSKWLDHRIGRGNIVYTAPTHRANVITKQNNPNANVYTLSALFGFTPDTDEAMERESLDLRELEFRSKNQVKYEPGQLIIIDEASMVQDGLYEYIQKIIAKDGVSVIYVGDSAQLRPVKSDHISKVFTSDGVPQITLTKVERTGDNPILKEATRLRRGEGLSYQTDINDKGQGVLYTSNDTVINENLKQIISSEEFNADPLHFRVITATNAAAATYNSKIRSLRYGKFAKPFVKGDILMGYSNKLRKPDGSYRLINSMDYIVQNVRDTTVKFKTDKGDIEFKAFKLSIRPIGNTIMDDFHITVIDKNEPDSKLFEIVEYKDRLWRMAKEAKQDKQISKYRDLVQMAFNIDNELNITKNLEDNQGRLKIRKAIDYGYAQTVWKSQGSTYSKVLILSNEIDTFGYGRDVMQLRNELRYVAVSRAKNFVIINSEAENKKKVSMRNEIAEEDLLDDIEFEPATEEQAIKASLQDSIDELTANGKQRRKECE